MYKVLSKDSTFLTYAVIYIFLKNKEIKNIDQHIYITNKKSAVRGFENISTIKLGDGEQQKPDCDLIIA